MRTTLAVLLALAFTQPAVPLHIVVIDGEDAVNVIQQKTAVAPLIEVRDRNNLPVAGATVTFTIGSNTASFAGGVQTFTVATNAAGQAAAAAINPLASGAVQINVAAAFQGQTAVATIAQTNVLTAAQAATAAGASSAGASSGSAGGSTSVAGGAAGGGGGISGTTIGIVGAAVAGGAVAATQLAGGNGGTKEVAGDFNIDLQMAFGPCVRNERYSGLLAIGFDSLDNEPLNGRATISNGRVDYVSTTAGCTTGPQAGQSGTFGMPPTSASGPKSSITFTASEVVSAATNTMNFQGAMMGDIVTGTLRLTTRVDNGALGVTMGSGTTTVTLSPH